jgi:hypothetical protein
MIETFKLLHDWSKWLITLETAICVGLWPKLTGAPRPSVLLYVGWMSFMASIVTATLLVVVIAFAARRVNEPRTDDLNRVRLLVVIEYVFFLAGVTCFIWRMLQVWTEPLLGPG